MADVPDRGIQSLIEWAGGERVIVAVAFTDIRDLTAKTDAVGDEAWHGIAEEHFAQSGRLIHRTNGRLVSNLGDGEMVIFKNVEEALDYALALHSDPGVAGVEVRVGVHVGPVRMLADNIRGGAVNQAARVGGATKAAEIWLSRRAL